MWCKKLKFEESTDQASVDDSQANSPQVPSITIINLPPPQPFPISNSETQLDKLTSPLSSRPKRFTMKQKKNIDIKASTPPPIVLSHPKQKMNLTDETIESKKINDNHSTSSPHKKHHRHSERKVISDSDEAEKKRRRHHRHSRKEQSQESEMPLTFVENNQTETIKTNSIKNRKRSSEFDEVEIRSPPKSARVHMNRTSRKEKSSDSLGEELETPKKTKSRGNTLKKSGDISFSSLAPQVEVSNSDFRSLKKPTPIATYQFIKTKQNTFFNKSFVYLFKFRDDIIFSATTKQKNPNGPVELVSTEPTNHRFFLFPEKENSLYSLRYDSEEGQILQTTEIQQIPFNSSTIRDINVTIESRKGLISLVSKKPNISRNGVLFLNFHHRLTKPSQKNCILVQKSNPNACDLLIFRKISDMTTLFETDIFLTISPVLVFSIVLSIYLSNP